MTKNKEIKRYEYIFVFNKKDGKPKYFKTRQEAINEMGRELECHNLQVDYVIKRNRKHSCEYVCVDHFSRFFINRVFINKM